MSETIPREALAHHLAILGKTGAGKSNAAKVVVEGALDAGERVCVIDPTGAWYGLRLQPNGKPSRFPVAIFGGLHADVPISTAHGAHIAEVVATSSTPAIIDTRLMTVGERSAFFTAFAQTLLRKNQGPLRLVIDEAHVFAPQGRVADPRSGEMLHAANNLVSLGRSIGLRIMMLTQRPAKLHKDSLTQIETLVAMRLIAPQDRAAVDDWIGEWAGKDQGRELRESLASLPTGDAWIWSPEIGFLERRHFPLASTYDSGKPTADGAAPQLGAIDLGALKEKLATVEAETKANDPRALKAEVARLKGELNKRATAAPPPQGYTRQEIEDADRAGYQRGFEEGERHGRVTGAATMLARAQDALDGLRIDAALSDAVAARPAPAPAPAAARAVPSAAPRLRAAVSASEAAGEVPPGCAKPLATLAGVYPAGMTEAQWATAAGYKRTGGTWGAYKSRLRSAGLIEQKDGRWFATEAGAEAAGDVELPPAPGPDLVRWWAAKLPGTPKIAEALIEAWPRAIGRDELAAAVNMSAAGGSFGAYLSRLASPGLIERDGGAIRLSAEAMGEP